MSSSELAHYGVKGMKWGVRRAEANKRNPDYSTADRTMDALRYPSGGVKRINKRMNKGVSLRQARKLETRRTALKAGAIVALYNAPRILRSVEDAINTHGPTIASTIRDRAETNRGRAHAAATMGLSSPPSFARKPKRGVYNITTK